VTRSGRFGCVGVSTDWLLFEFLLLNLSTRSDLFPDTGSPFYLHRDLSSSFFSFPKESKSIFILGFDTFNMYQTLKFQFIKPNTG
jgi:hypothetical protein